jgi:hypothetical protein
MERFFSISAQYTIQHSKVLWLMVKDRMGRDRAYCVFHGAFIFEALLRHGHLL